VSDTPLVGIVMGSESDRPTIQRCCEVLDGYGVSYEVVVRSAHRDPEGCREWATQAEGRGLKVLIAAAGGAAHLPGVVAAWSLLPVIGVPMSGGALGGLDALLSMAQMPAGIPVATVFAATFAVGSGLAGLGGALGVELLGLDPYFPLKFMIYFLIVVTVGGTSSITGPFVASLLIGIADVTGKYYVPKFGAFVIYTIMIIVLILRPQGLFARAAGK